jgi:hypothetical protein
MAHALQLVSHYRHGKKRLAAARQAKAQKLTQGRGRSQPHGFALNKRNQGGYGYNQGANQQRNQHRKGSNRPTCKHRIGAVLGHFTNGSGMLVGLKSMGRTMEKRHALHHQQGSKQRNLEAVH